MLNVIITTIFMALLNIWDANVEYAFSTEEKNYVAFNHFNEWVKVTTTEDGFALELTDCGYVRYEGEAKDLTTLMAEFVDWYKA